MSRVEKARRWIGESVSRRLAIPGLILVLLLLVQALLSGASAIRLVGRLEDSSAQSNASLALTERLLTAARELSEHARATVDATVVRATLVPAFMKLAGDANWWAPAPLRRLQERFGLHEAPPDRAPSAGEPVGDGRNGGRIGHEEGVPTVEPAQLGPFDLTGEGLLGGGEGDAVVAAGRDQHG